MHYRGIMLLRKKSASSNFLSMSLLCKMPSAPLGGKSHSNDHMVLFGTIKARTPPTKRCDTMEVDLGSYLPWHTFLFIPLIVKKLAVMQEPTTIHHTRLRLGTTIPHNICPSQNLAYLCVFVQAPRQDQSTLVISDPNSNKFSRI